MFVIQASTLGGVSAGERVRDLRKALDLTQGQAAEMTDGKVDQVIFSQIETGKNKATSYAIRAGLARAFGTRIEDLAAYLDGEIDLGILLRRRSQLAPGATVVVRDERYPNLMLALEFARTSGIPEDFLARFTPIALSREDDPSPAEWWEYIQAEVRHERLHRKDPQAAARLEAIDGGEVPKRRKPGWRKD
jgi:transcriptional regulator with XRE-family HTH domain